MKLKFICHTFRQRIAHNIIKIVGNFALNRNKMTDPEPFGDNSSTAPTITRKRKNTGNSGPEKPQKNDDGYIAPKEECTLLKSKRQKKKDNSLKNSIRNNEKEMEKSISYLTKWNTNRDEWKYEKLRQIFIQKNIFDDEVIPDEHCDVAIRYLSTSKGHARKIINQSAGAVIEEIEKKITPDNQDVLTSTSKYKRAREILQCMQD